MSQISNLNQCTDEFCSDSNIERAYSLAKNIAKAKLPYPIYEDVASEVVVALLDNLRNGRFRGDSAFETYVHAIAKRKVVDKLREKYSNNIEARTLLAHMPPPPLASTYWREQKRKLDKCLALINPKDRLVFELHYYKEMTYNEIGELLGVCSRTACIRGRRALRKVLFLFGDMTRCSRKSGVG